MKWASRKGAEDMKVVLKFILFLVFLTGVPVSAERVLFPVPVGVFAGAHQSLWRTSLTITNFGTAPVVLSTGGGIPFSLFVNPQSTLVVSSLPNAYWWTISRDEEVALHLSVGGEGRRTETEIPVVRDDEFVPDVVHLTGIPVEPETRLLLRVFAILDEPNTTVPMEVVMRDGLTHSVLGAWERNVAVRDFPGITSFSMPLPSSFGGNVVVANVTVTEAAESRIWAFVTATDNVTQEIHTVSP